MDLVLPDFGLLFWTIFTFSIIIFPVLAFISILRNRFNGNDKLIWVLVVLFLPLFGSILYFVIGRSKRFLEINN